MDGRLQRALRSSRFVGLTAAAAAAPATCDIDVATSVSPSDPAPGEEMELRVSVTNREPVAVSDVTVNVEVPPARVEVMEADPTHGSFSESQGVWDVGAMASGKEARLILTLEVRDLEPGEEP